MTHFYFADQRPLSSWENVQLFVTERRIAIREQDLLHWEKRNQLTSIIIKTASVRVFYNGINWPWNDHRNFWCGQRKDNPVFNWIDDINPFNSMSIWWNVRCDNHEIRSYNLYSNLKPVVLLSVLLIPLGIAYKYTVNWMQTVWTSKLSGSFFFYLFAIY